MPTVTAEDLRVIKSGTDNAIVTVEIEIDDLLERRAAKIAEATGLSINLVINQALVTGLLLELLK